MSRYRRKKVKRQKRNRTVTVRLNTAELNDLAKRANQIRKGLSTFMREIALHGEIKAPPRIENINFYSEVLNPIGVNLNQLVRLCHSGKIPPDLLPLLNDLLVEQEYIVRAIAQKN